MSQQTTKRFKYRGLQKVWVPAISQWVNPGDTVKLPTNLGVSGELWQEVKTRKRKAKEE